MPFKCPCCPKKKATDSGFGEDLYRKALIEEERRKRTARILKEDVYEGIMKKLPTSCCK